MPRVKSWSQSRKERYLKKCRERALKIIAAETQYSKPFRAEVKDALDNWPHKLDALFLEAERMDQRDTRSTKPRTRSMLWSAESYADKTESLLAQHSNEYLDHRMAERAKMLSEILLIAAADAEIDLTHPKIVGAFMRVIWACWPKPPFAAAAMSHMRDIVNGCSDDDWQHIKDFWSSDESVRSRARSIDECFQHALRQAQRRGETVTEPVPRSTGTGKTITASRDATQINAELDRLRERAQFLDHLPENESARFELQTEIENLERELAAVEEWPDEIGGEA